MKKPVRHGTTRKICMICMCEPESPIVLHRTKRQIHVMCRDCAQEYITKAMQSNINKKDYNFPPMIKCPGNPYGERRNQCCHELLITTEKFGMLEGVNDLLTKIALLSNPDTIGCPSCDNMFIAPREEFNFGGGIVRNVTCHGCDTEFCRECKVTPHHFGMSCKQWREYSSSTQEGQELNALESSGVLRRCPRCRNGVVKQEDDPGCNKMHCEFEINGVQCGETWCWICGKVGIDYSHFESGECAGNLFHDVNAL